MLCFVYPGENIRGLGLLKASLCFSSSFSRCFFVFVVVFLHAVLLVGRVFVFVGVLISLVVFVCCVFVLFVCVVIFLNLFFISARIRQWELPIPKVREILTGS